MDDAALLALAATQHGVVGDPQAIELGYSARTIRRRVQSGEWHRPLPRVLRCVGAPDSGRQAAMAAVLWGGPEAVVSHATAGVLWALDGVATRRVEITVPEARDVRSARLTVHRSRALEPADRTESLGVPVTSITRTLIDLAGPLSMNALELAVEDAFRRRLTSPLQLADRLTALDGQRRAGFAALRVLLDTRGPGAASGSGAEVRLERVLVRGGLPRPVRQHAVTYGDRTIYVDLAYPDRRLAIEFDSLRWHTGRSRLDSDAERRNLLGAAGWHLVTITDTMLRRPSAALAIVSTAYANFASVGEMRPRVGRKPPTDAANAGATV